MRGRLEPFFSPRTLKLSGSVFANHSWGRASGNESGFDPRKFHISHQHEFKHDYVPRRVDAVLHAARANTPGFGYFDVLDMSLHACMRAHSTYAYSYTVVK